ncbi:hypothetical protein [Bradyrhizobium sp. UFLA05-112]
MDIPENARLEKLLGMLGSSFDGERANAARLMAEKQGLTVVELIYGVGLQRCRQQKSKPEQPEDDPRATVMPDARLKALAKIADNPERYRSVLTDWEFQFAVDVSERYARDFQLSERQLGVVEKILRKARRTARK